jgi:phosphoglycerate dehydrogenase-like enzyme
MWAWHPLRAQATLDVWPEEGPPPRDEVLRRITGVDGFLAMVVEIIDAELLERAGPRLRVVSNFGVGFDNIVGQPGSGSWPRLSWKHPQVSSSRSATETSEPWWSR